MNQRQASSLGQVMRVPLALYDFLVIGLAAFSALSVAAMALWVTYEVIVRYFLSQPTSWSTELAGYALIWSTFLAAPWVLRHNAHVSVDLLTQRLSPRVQRPLAVAVALAGAATCAIFAWETAASVLEFYERGRVIVQAWTLPQFIPYLPIPIGGALLTTEFLRQAWLAFRGEPAGQGAKTSSEPGV